MKQKKILAFMLTFMMVLSLMPTNISFAAINASDFAGGSGTQADPYRIVTLAQLEAFRDSVNDNNPYNGKYVKLMADIDMSNNYGSTASGSWTPIGNQYYDFEGTFDGNGHKITGLYVYSSDTYLGLFGYVRGTVKNLSVSGSVTGKYFIGGIAGALIGTVENCYSDVELSFYDMSGEAGGIASLATGGSIIRNCYYTGKIIPYDKSGFIGGIAGWSYEGAKIENNYSIGEVGSETSNYSGGIVGYDDGAAMTNNYYKYGTAVRGVGHSTTSSGTAEAITAEDMGKQEKYVGWDFENVWVMDEDEGRPFLRSCSEKAGTEKYPYLISDIYELELFRDAVNNSDDGYKDKHVKLTNYIDMTSKYNAANGGWVPIGTSSHPFNGTFDGGGNAIKVYYNASETCGGLFGYTGGSSVIENLGVSGEVTIIGTYAGGIVGDNGGVIRKCYNTAKVTNNLSGSGSAYAGGIAGYMEITGGIENCYNTGAVEGDTYVGAIVGHSDGADVYNCYNTVRAVGSMSSNIDIYGNCTTGTKIKYCYTTVGYDVGSENEDEYIIRITTEGLAKQDTFSSFDFENVWVMDTERPLLRGCLEPTGSVLSPQNIYNLDEFKAFRDAVNGGNSYSGKHVKLMADIDLGGSESNKWTSIGNTEDRKFKGTFDGNGHKITGLYINDNTSYTGYRAFGLFGNIEDATIKNLACVSGSVTVNRNNDRVGGIVGRVWHDKTDSYISNCCSAVNVTGTGGGDVGGIAGVAGSYTFITDCCNTGNISGRTLYIGGIVGDFSTVGEVKNCYNTGNVTSTNGEESVGAYIGGIAGDSSSNVNNCYNVGTVTAPEGVTKVGGIVGNIREKDTVTASYYIETSAGEHTTFDCMKGEEKSADDFASGEVAYLLQSDQTTQVWGQTLTGDSTDNYPVLTSDDAKKVHKVSFMQKDSESESGYKEFTAAYANKGGTVAKYPTDKPEDNDYSFVKWSVTDSADGDEFTAATKVYDDMPVYAVGKELTVASTESDTVNLRKGMTIAAPIELKKFVENKSGKESDNFVFALSEGSELPAGITLNETDGTLNGNPTCNAGVYTVKFDVTNNNGIALMSVDTAASTGVETLTLKLNIDLEQGSGVNTYLINNLDELKYFRDSVNSGRTYTSSDTVKLNANIDLGGSANPWTPIGRDWQTCFYGTFDGAGHKVTGMYIHVSDGGHAGFFGAKSYGTVKNLGVEGDIICTNGNNIGGIVGWNSGSAIINCYHNGNVEGSDGSAVGGIAGWINNSGTINRCYNVGDVTGGVVQHQICYMDGNTLFGSGSNNYYLANTDDGNGGKTAEQFKNGEVAWLLQNGQSEQVWGLRRVNTNVPKDDYPVLTSDESLKIYKLSFLKNNEGEGDYTAYDGKDKYLNKGDSLIEFPSISSELHIGWSETAGGEKLSLPYTFDKTEDTELFSVWKGKVTFDVDGKNHTYAADTVRQIKLTPKVNGAETDKLSASDFDVKYYPVEENSGGVDVHTWFKKPVSIGKFFYVIDFADDDDLKNDYYIDRFYDINNPGGPENEPGNVNTENWDNIGYMYIASGAENAQKPIYFEKQVVNAKMTDTVSNSLVNPNASTVTYTSSDTNVATIDSDGKVTIKDAGSTVIVATSQKENASDVYASYTLNVTKEVITVTANANSISYGDDFANGGYTVSKEGAALGGTPVFTTDYTNGDGVGKYEINVSGLTSDLYDIEYKSGKLTVGAKELTADDFEVTVNAKTYNGSEKAEVTAKVKNESLVSGDAVTVLVSGTFDKSTVDASTVNYTISGLSGKDSNNYVVKNNNIDGSKEASITKAKVTVSVPSYTSYVYDRDGKSVSVFAYANGIYFDKFEVTYNNSKTLPTDIGKYTVGINLTDNNYELDGEINATLEIKPAQQDVFSIEGISDSVTYGDELTLTTAGAIEGGTVSYEITSGSNLVELNGNKITTKGIGTVTVKATSTMTNYADKTATRTFVIKPKTISVTAEAKNKVYDGTKNVEVTLTPDGVLSRDSVTVTKTSATVATADVENSKTVFVSGLSIENPNYQLSATSVQTTVNITKKPITNVTFKAADKTYDGSDEVLSYTTGSLEDGSDTIGALEEVIDSDKNFVTVTGTAKFDDKNVNKVTKATLTDLALSGTKSGNYELKVTSLEDTNARINQATVNFEFGTLSYVYDEKAKTVPITATVGGKAFSGYTVKYGGEADRTEVGKYDIEITLNDSDNYTSDYTSKKQLEITTADQSEMTITGLLGTIEYGKTFALNAVGGSGDISVTWSSSDPNIATVDNAGVVSITGVDNAVTITATKEANDNFNKQSASVSFTPVKKNVIVKITNLTQTYDGEPKAAKITTAANSFEVKYFDENNEKVDSPTNAGTYYVEVTATGNYEGEQNAILTIKKAKRNTDDISLAVPENLVYGKDYDVTVNGYDGEDGVITYTGTGLYGGQTEKPTNAGSYTATLTISNDNFETATVTKKFEIAKATLYAKPDDAARAYGAQNPVFTIKYYSDEACRNEVTNADVMIAPIMSTSATASTAAGEHKISATGGYAENYTFRYVDGTLTIDPITDGTLYITGSSNTVRVDDVFTLYAFYGNSMVNAVWSVKDDSPKDVIELEPETGKVTAKKYGTVTIVATADENYGKKTAEFTLNVKQTGITLTPINLVKTYNGDWQDISFAENPDFTPILSGDDKNIDITYTLISDPTVTEPVKVGTYSVVYTINDGSYSGGGTATMYITKATVTVSAKEISKEYGEDPVYELNVSDNVKGIDADTMKEFVTITSDGAAKTANVGEYPITAELTKTSDENCDYVVNTEANGKLNVTPAKLTVNVADITREYGAQNPTELTYTIDGFKNGETAEILTGSIAPVYAETIEEKLGTQKDVVTADGTLENGNYTVEVKYVDGNGADLTITKVPVKASAGTSKAGYLTVRFDKGVEGLTAENFTVKNGEEAVTLTSVTASIDNMTYTLNGTFTVGTAYTVEITYDNATQEITEGQTLTITPTRTSSSSGGGGGGSSSSSIYTVTFETNGGSKVDNVKVTKNNTAAKPTEPTKDGYVFDGWYTDSEFATEYDFDTKVTKSITLYAKWTEKKVDDNKDDNKDDNNNPAPSEWKNPFTDVKENDWFFDNVRYANENGLMSGTTATTFAPNDNLTRGMLVTVLYRADGEPAVNKSIPFADVNASQYYANAVIWAEQNGIVKGVSETEFAPDENITREQIATIIYRYAEYKGIAPTGAWAIKLDYADAADISDYAVDGVMYCTMKNIMQGKENNMFAPKDNATRAEIAAILNRFIESNK